MLRGGSAALSKSSFLSAKQAPLFPACILSLPCYGCASSCEKLRDRDLLKNNLVHAIATPATLLS